MNATVATLTLRTIVQMVLAVLQYRNVMTADDVSSLTGILETFYPILMSLVVWIWQWYTKWNTKAVPTKSGNYRLPARRDLQLTVSPLTGKVHYTPR